MNLVRDVGEFGLIRRWADLLGASARRGVVVGIGDDAAVLETGGDKLLLVTTDMLVEDVHFRKRYTPMDALGWKALAVSVSDIAAMGGLPTFAFVSVGLHRDTPLEAAEGIYAGLAAMAESVGVSVVGGDTVSAEKIVVNVTLLGEVERELVALRSGACVGDALLVTGTLGDARVGLEMLEGSGRRSLTGRCEAALLRPQPRVQEARAAVATGAVHAMIDLSDGLWSDLGHICDMSGVGAVVDEDAVPTSDDLRRISEDEGLDLLRLALCGGEDYELLMAVAPDRVGDVLDAVKDCGRTFASVVGRVTEKPGLAVRRSDGTLVSMHYAVWEHFPKP